MLIISMMLRNNIISKRKVWLILLALIVILISSVVFCMLTARKYDEAFDHISVGESEANVIDAFGKPDVRQFQDTAFEAYLTEPCISPCAERLWWEAPFPVPRGLEAWVIEFDSSNKVMRKYFIAFP